MSKEPVNGSKTKNPLNDIFNSVVKDPDGGFSRCSQRFIQDVVLETIRIIFVFLAGKANIILYMFLYLLVFGAAYVYYEKNYQKKEREKY